MVYAIFTVEMTVISLILILVVLPAVMGFLLYSDYVGGGGLISAWHNQFHGLFRDDFEPGDFLIYRKSKASPRPGPRARNIQAAENGDDYYYEVDKFWTLSGVLDDGRLVAQTRRGKQVCLAPTDERLRRAGLIERIRYRQRFPSV